MKRNGRTTVRAYTLLEVLMACCVVAVLSTSAVSGYEMALQAQRASAARSVLLLGLNRLRSAATLHDVDAAMCPSSNGTTCSTSAQWHDGWIGYLDANGSNGLDAADPVLERRGRLGDGISVLTSSGRRRIELQSNGTNAGSNATFTICDRRGPARATAIVMSNEGRYRVVERPPSAAACPAY